MFCCIQHVCVYPVQMCVSRAVLLHHHPPPPTTTTPTCAGCLSIGLTWLHGSGPPPALWIPPIDLFQETLAAGKPEIKEEGVGYKEKRVILLESLFDFVVEIISFHLWPLRGV